MRAFWAIALRAFRSSGSGGAKASPHAGYAMLLSSLVVFCLIAAVWFSYFVALFTPEPGPENVVVVNAPDSFIEYVESDVFIGMGFNFTYEDHPYAFDVATFSEMMKKADSRLTVVFNNEGDVLTFYPADSLDNTEFKEDFKTYILDGYSDHIKTMAGITIVEEGPLSIGEEGMEDPESDSAGKSVLSGIAFMIVPLLFFISALYASMMKGTNVIAGAKEQNTFAAILMTPIPRKTIILGNIAGVWMSAMIPVTVITLPLFLVPLYRPGVIPAYIIMSVLAVFIASVVILISVLSNNVITAQTAFLPVFFVFISVCISSMQDPDQFTGAYEFIPLYGQYLGIGKALTFEFNVPALLCSTLSTLLLSFACIMISIKLLYSERFTVSVLSASDKEVIRARRQAKADARKKTFLKAKTTVFGYKPKSSLNDLSFSLTQLFRPLVLLSVFQLIAMIPPLLMSNGEYLTNIISDLKKVEGVADIVTSGSSIIGVLMSTPAFLLSMGLGYILIDLYYCGRVKFIERTPLSSGLGLPRQHIVRRLLTGALIGSSMMGFVFLALLATGQIRVTGFGIASESLPLFFSFVFMWLFQGACEEIMFRGYMMPRVAARYGLVPAIAVSAILFCLFHGMNPGFSVLAAVNLILVSVLYALIAYFTDNIWIVCAAHTFWNFTQGNIFGLEVSGNSGNVTLIHTEVSDNINPLISGGSFGPEGGLAVTIASIIGIAIVLVIFRKRLGNGVFSRHI